MKKTLFLCACVTISLFLAQVSGAGTFENDDSYPYNYQIVEGGQTLDGTIYDDSTMYGFCNSGCQLTLTGSGQSIYMEPGDYIIIENGVMKEKPAD